MQMNAKVLAGTTQILSTKKGTQLEKTRLKVLDTGVEVASDVQVYWIDFIGDAALSEDELASINHEEVVIEIRRVSATAGRDGRAYLNISGGLILLGSMPVQSKLVAATTSKKSK